MLDMLIPFRLHAGVTSNNIKFNMATIVNFILIVLKIKSGVNNIVPTFVRSYFNTTSLRIVLFDDCTSIVNQIQTTN